MGRLEKMPSTLRIAMKRIIIMFLCFLVVCPIIFAETDEVQPQGVYVQIDTKREMQATDSLLNGTEKVKAQTAKEIVDNSGKYCPSVFFYLSRYFFYILKRHRK